MSPTTSRYGSIAELQKAYQDGNVSVKEVTQQYLATIESLNGDLNALTAVNKNALDEAERLDGLPREQRGPLYGVPMVIKDQIETAGIPTAYGSAACKDYIPPKDATVVTKLKAAGVVVLGKSTMCDWAAGWVSASSLSGTTKHPIDHARDPGGSSSGNGTAVASDMALAAIGGDTGGSIRLPASFCGLVGVRVTPGRISRDGMSSLIQTLDTPGPMVKTVEDAARLLDVLVGFDENDDFTSINAMTGRSTSATQFVDAIKQPLLEGKRLGILRQAFGDHKGVNSVLDKALLDLKDAGVELIDVEIPNLEDYLTNTSGYILRSKSDVNHFLASREGLAHLKLEDLHSAGTYHKSLDLINMVVKGPTDPSMSPHYARVLAKVGEFQRTVGSIFAKYNLDAIIYPTSKQLAPKTANVLAMDSHLNTDSPNTIIGSQLLFTALSVPIGKAKDDLYPDDPELPVGLEVLGVPLSEERILNIAAAIEALQHKRG
ncbi:hypothetical protein DOTSEDRAFT_46266 [Dothistroma septosporum NZE10]|uniref:Amidase domain-containing protein n=1 Tax=Dothistroma septosporum (strain NZE10 / CBS 128990) TaxID=675120 RepID=N1PGI9_DOTSN|nr:hypothetical protein DOTSEDRAFT_46266 [Dothistroma septosporum NZE10]